MRSPVPTAREQTSARRPGRCSFASRSAPRTTSCMANCCRAPREHSEPDGAGVRAGRRRSNRAERLPAIRRSGVALVSLRYRTRPAHDRRNAGAFKQAGFGAEWPQRLPFMAPSDTVSTPTDWTSPALPSLDRRALGLHGCGRIHRLRCSTFVQDRPPRRGEHRCRPQATSEPMATPLLHPIARTLHAAPHEAFAKTDASSS
jgi:hypothetical protein